MTAPRRSGSRPARAAALAWRQLSLLGRRRLIRVPVAEITDEFAFSLTGWHHFTSVLAELDRRPSWFGIEPGEQLWATELARFFRDEAVNAVRDLNDLLDLGPGPDRFDDLPRFWLGTYPWGGLLADDIGTAGPAFGLAHDRATGADTRDLWGRGRNLWYEPRDRYTIEHEWRRTAELYRSIRRRYSPLRSRGFPTVTLLRHRDGRRRAVIVDGHHRLAVLAHLGARAVTIEVEATVDLADVDHWYHVRNGHCTAEEARPFFEAFFELDGRERLAATPIGADRSEGRS